MWLDVLFFLPLTLLVVWLSSRFRLFHAFYFVPSICISAIYSIYLVKRFGGTPGKIIAGLRIAKLDGSAIGYHEAILRFLPEFALTMIMSVGLILATFQMGDEEYRSLVFIERSQRMVALAPSWLHPIQIIQNVWIWGEFIVLLTNKRRRALHDFIAGTVVVLRRSNQILLPTPASPSTGASVAPDTGAADL
jgi:uncharacterized RDD family membrane protein YckC